MATEKRNVCGWCITGHHDSCKPEITYYDKTWKCECTTCNRPKRKPREKK